VLTSAENDLNRSSDDTRVLVQGWTHVSTTKDASGEPISGQIGISHAQRAQAQLFARQRWLAAVELERGEVPARKPSGVMNSGRCAGGSASPSGPDLPLELLGAASRCGSGADRP
jgi:hypothetical protein